MANPYSPPHSIDDILAITREDRVVFATFLTRTFGSIESPLVTERLSQVVSDADERTRHLVVDMQAVSSVNSMALGALVTISSMSMQRGLQLVLLGVSDMIRDTFRYTRLDQVFTFCADHTSLPDVIGE